MREVAVVMGIDGDVCGRGGGRGEGEGSAAGFGDDSIAVGSRLFG